jgi:hypothetical protein
MDRLRNGASLPRVTLHLIADDLSDHAWYEELFVRTIADVEAFAARWAAFEEAATAFDASAGAESLPEA